jgi:hypothetical protein
MAHRTYVPRRNSSTWDDLAGRLGKFEPGIHLADYVDFGVQNAIDVMGYPSEGINFVLARSQRDPLLRRLRDARTRSGKQAFQTGRWKGVLHAAKGAGRDLLKMRTGDSWAANISYMATTGIGFRQIWYMELSDRQLRLKHAHPAFSDMPKLDPKFTAMFHAPNRSLDLSSVHWAIGDADPKTGRSKCNVHVDQVGIMANLQGQNRITPDTGYHGVVELAFRTGLKGILPDSVLQRMDFILPSAQENYALNFGVQYKIVDRKHVNFSFRGVCEIENGGLPWSLSLNLGGTHGVGGGD